MTHIFTPTRANIDKWKKQAYAAAKHLKKMSIEKDVIKIGFAFDDGVITVPIASTTIQALDENKLGDEIYNFVLAAAQTKRTKGNA